MPHYRDRRRQYKPARATATKSNESSGDITVYKGSIAILLIFIYVSVFIYEVIIATLGRPVVISGNCMLIELDAKLGFLDSEIQSYWKAFTGITGL